VAQHRLLAASFAVVVALVIPHLIHAATLDLRIMFEETSLSSLSVPAELDGYRIAFVSDTHNMDAGRLNQIRSHLDDAGIDLLILGGDYSTRGGPFGEVFAVLGGTRASDGVIAVEGNHDRRRAWIPAAREQGTTVLINHGTAVRPGLFVAGVSEYMEGEPSVHRATAGAGAEDFVLLVSHNPIVTRRQDTSGVDLVLSGHTHGGQVTFFGMWAPALMIPSRTGTTPQHLRGGWSTTRDGTAIYVSHGAGTHLPRVWARPEVTIITLRAAE
jgi:predicted MPP superfamily phosphohydrolase